VSLNESIVEDAALILPAATLTLPLPAGEEQSRFARTLIPALSHGEKEKREAIRRLNPAVIQSRTLATLRDTLLPKLLSGELSVAADSVIRESRITAADGPSQSAASQTRRETAR